MQKERKKATTEGKKQASKEATSNRQYFSVQKIQEMSQLQRPQTKQSQTNAAQTQNQERCRTWDIEPRSESNPTFLMDPENTQIGDKRMLQDTTIQPPSEERKDSDRHMAKGKGKFLTARTGKPEDSTKGTGRGIGKSQMQLITPTNLSAAINAVAMEVEARPSNEEKEEDPNL